MRDQALDHRADADRILRLLAHELPAGRCIEEVAAHVTGGELVQLVDRQLAALGRQVVAQERAHPRVPRLVERSEPDDALKSAVL